MKKVYNRRWITVASCHFTNKFWRLRRHIFVNLAFYSRSFYENLNFCFFRNLNLFFRILQRNIASFWAIPSTKIAFSLRSFDENYVFQRFFWRESICFLKFFNKFSFSVINSVMKFALFLRRFVLFLNFSSELSIGASRKI